MSEFLYRIPNKKLAWDFLSYLDLIATREKDARGFVFTTVGDGKTEGTLARDSLYKQLCMSEDKSLGWPVQKVAETFPRKKLKKKDIKKFIK